MNKKWEELNCFAWDLVQLSTQVQQTIEELQKQMEDNHDTQQ